MRTAGSWPGLLKSRHSPFGHLSPKVACGNSHGRPAVRGTWSYVGYDRFQYFHRGCRFIPCCTKMPDCFNALHRVGEQPGIFFHRVGERLDLPDKVFVDGRGLETLQRFRAGV